MPDKSTLDIVAWESLRQARIEISDLRSRLEIAEDKVARAFAILGEQCSSYSLKGGKLRSRF